MSLSAENHKDNLILSFFNKNVEPKTRLRLRMLLFTNKLSENIEKVIQSLLDEIRCIDYIVVPIILINSPNQDMFEYQAIIYHTTKSVYAPIKFCTKYNTQHYSTSQSFAALRSLVQELPSSQIKCELSNKKEQKLYHTACCQTDIYNNSFANSFANNDQQNCQDDGDLIASDEKIQINFYMTPNIYYAAITQYNLLIKDHMHIVIGCIKYDFNKKIPTIKLEHECTCYTNTLLLSNRASGITCDTLKQILPELITMAKTHSAQCGYRVIQNLKAVNILIYPQHTGKNVFEKLISELYDFATVSVNDSVNDSVNTKKQNTTTTTTPKVNQDDGDTEFLLSSSTSGNKDSEDNWF